MFFMITDDSPEYRIGKVTIDSSFHTQTADESFFSYFNNDALFSITRTIHPDDLDEFKKLVASVENDEIKQTVIRMKSADDDYRWMIMRLSVNRQMLVTGIRYIDIIVKDILKIENETTAFENVINNFRYLLSLQETIVFEYNSQTRRIAVYSFDYNINTVFFNEDIDYFCFRVKAENMIHQADTEDFESFCSSLKNSDIRFTYEMNTNILTGGEHMQNQVFRGFTVADGQNNKMTMGTISLKDNNGQDSKIIFETTLDPLTNLLNKKVISNYAVNKIESVSGENVTIVIIDIDDFKNINDRYGHLFGDEILCSAAKILKKEFAARGVAGRIGGDEFMAVLSDVKNEAELRSMLRAVRSNINILYADKMPNLNVSCSMGTASYPADAGSYRELFMAADKALYIAKQNGKGRYVIYNVDKHGPVEESKDISGASSMVVNKTDKAEAVSSLIIETLVTKRMTVTEIFRSIAEIFQLDSVSVYIGNDMERQFVWSSSASTLTNAYYIFYENYLDNFGEGNLFVIDDTNILEDRNITAFKMLMDNSVNASVQYIFRKNGQIYGMITFDLIGHHKKWPQTDINYMSVLGKVILSSLINDYENGGDFFG